MTKDEIVLKLILYLKISMIFGHLIATQIRVFLNGTDKKIWKLEMTIRKKWNPKVLLLVNIIFKKYKEKDGFFNPERFLEEFGREKHFGLLKAWKADVEESYLNEYSYLRFASVRHEKCLMSKRRPCLR